MARPIGLRFSDGRTLGRTLMPHAGRDDVVLALWQSAVRALPAQRLQHDVSNQRYVSDPWAQPLRFSPGESRAAVGSG